ncbi:MAG: thiamine pyrophosphate-binding protein [Labilithrix sp.]|nr:thiamine pyrophosphate-binding protein [Labilithrix sp.]
MAETYSHGFAAPESAVARDAGRRTADVLIDVLIDAGVEVVFGLPGGAIAPLNDALLDRPEVRVVTTRHESGAMFAAAAYARTTGKLAVVLVTSGPGVYNAMTGLASAYCDGMPVLLIAGEVPRSVFGRRALQEGSSHHLDIVTTCRPISKMAAQIPFADQAPSMLRQAISTALTESRGPVVLTIPLDVLSKTIRAPRLANDLRVVQRTDSLPMNDAIDEAARALGSAKRPLIFVGSGARWDDGPERVRELAERLQAPVMTTPKAKGVFPEGHPLSLGVFGYGGHPSTTRYLERGVDALLTVGSSLGDVATNGWSKLLSPSKHFIQIDVDASQIGRNYPVTCGLIGSAGPLLERITAALPRQPRARRELGVARFTDPSIDQHGSEGRITPMRALWELQRALPSNTRFTCDIGEHLLFAIHYIEAHDPEHFMVMTGLGSMGSSIAGALGVRLGANTPAAAICGDGCFAMNLSDLAVAARERIPIVVAVLNDERYGMVELGHEAIYGRTPEYPAGPMSVALMARSVGADATTIEHNNEIAAVDFSGLREGRPLVLDIRIDRSVKMPKNGRFDDIKATAKTPALN